MHAAPISFMQDGGGPLMRSRLFPNYQRDRQRRRTRRAVRRLTSRAGSWLQLGAINLNLLLHGARHRDRQLWRAAEACGFQAMEAHGGLEADDSIAALCKLISGGCPLLAASVRSPCQLHLPAWVEACASSSLQADIAHCASCIVIPIVWDGPASGRYLTFAVRRAVWDGR